MAAAAESLGLFSIAPDFGGAAGLFEPVSGKPFSRCFASGALGGAEISFPGRVFFLLEL
jgi:hypothetical protein